MKVFKKLVLWTFIFGLLVLVWIVAVNLSVNNISNKYYHADVTLLSGDAAQAVMILGARVYRDGTISEIYLERINTAIKVYKLGNAENILISADNSSTNYDEVRPVANYLISQGIPVEDIFLDFAGFDTYDSLYRAKHIFEIENIIVCSQNFHIPRAIYIADKLGFVVRGIEAEGRQRNTLVHEGREKIANIKAWLNIVFHAKSYFGGNIISIAGYGNAKEFLKK